MRQGGEPRGVQIVRQGEPTPYHCDFNSLYKVQAAFECRFRILKSSLHLTGCLKAKLQQSSRSGIYARYFSNLPVFVGHKSDLRLGAFAIGIAADFTP